LTEKPKRILTDEQRKRKAEANRKRYLKNRTQILAQQKEYYKDNQTDIRIRRKSYWTEYNTRSDVVKSQALWKINNPEKVAINSKRYRDRKKKESKS